jgi:kumamolisin
VAPASSGLNPSETIDVTVVLRRRSPLPSDEERDDEGALSRAEFASRYGADDADADLVSTTLTGLGLTVSSVDLASRRVRVSGDVATISRVFGVDVTAVTSRTSGGTQVQHRHRTGQLSIPANLDGVVTAVLGIDDRPQSRAQFHRAQVQPEAATGVSYTPVQLGTIYNFPPGTDGTGQTIAIIELGGGYKQSDLTTYFGGLNVPLPSITSVGVDGANNGGGTDPQGADGEVLLDVEIVGALAPAASIKVYFAPNTDAGFLDAVADAAHATPTPTAMSISWGQSEDQWTPQARTALDEAMADASTLGVTVTAAAGDNGSSDGATDGTDHADFPASSPHALACGGTRLTTTAETVWNNGPGSGATGGGVSDVFPLPSWQRHAGVPKHARAKGGRGVPDVAGDADPNTGYEVLVDGTRAVYGGTSAVAPLWAALIARIVQSLGSPIGLAQPRLYKVRSGFRDVTSGNNGSYSAGAGWDACTGLGSPDGTELLAALRATRGHRATESG